MLEGGWNELIEKLKRILFRSWVPDIKESGLWVFVQKKENNYYEYLHSVQLAIHNLSGSLFIILYLLFTIGYETGLMSKSSSPTPIH